LAEILKKGKREKELQIKKGITTAIFEIRTKMIPIQYRDGEGT
jgi:hypothetical protein